MATIYEQHDAAFTNVSAFVVLNNKGNLVARIALKFPRDGAGRLYAYVHWIGVSMVRGYAGGYGYDKRSAAVADAVRKIELPIDLGLCGAEAFAQALNANDGGDWTDKLRGAGFTVLQAV